MVAVTRIEAEVRFVRKDWGKSEIEVMHRANEDASSFQLPHVGHLYSIGSRRHRWVQRMGSVDRSTDIKKKNKKQKYYGSYKDTRQAHIRINSLTCPSVYCCSAE